MRSLSNCKSKLIFHSTNLRKLCHNKWCKTPGRCPRMCCGNDHLNIETAVLWKTAEEISDLLNLLSLRNLELNSFQNTISSIYTLEWIFKQHELKLLNYKQQKVVKSAIKYTVELAYYIEYKFPYEATKIKTRKIFKE